MSPRLEGGFLFDKVLIKAGLKIPLSHFRYRTLFCVTLIPLIFADHFRKFCFVFPTKVRNVIIFHLRLSAFSARTNHAFSGLPQKVYGREITFWAQGLTSFICKNSPMRSISSKNRLGSTTLAWNHNPGLRMEPSRY